jgi:hypothetical protein
VQAPFTQRRQTVGARVLCVCGGGGATASVSCSALMAGDPAHKRAHIPLIEGAHGDAHPPRGWHTAAPAGPTGPTGPTGRDAGQPHLEHAPLALWGAPGDEVHAQELQRVGLVGLQALQQGRRVPVSRRTAAPGGGRARMSAVELFFVPGHKDQRAALALLGFTGVPEELLHQCDNAGERAPAAATTTCEVGLTSSCTS